MSQYPPPPPEPEGYPGMGSMPPGQQPQQVDMSQPASISLAVKLMYVGAVLSVVGSLVTLTMRDAIREQVEKGAADSGQQMAPAAVDAAVALGVGVAIFTGVLGALLWVFMAWANGRGKSWARIVSTVLYGLSVLSFLGSFIQRPPALPLVLSLVSIVLGGLIIFLLWKKESSAYYAAQSAPRY